LNHLLTALLLACLTSSPIGGIQPHSVDDPKKAEISVSTEVIPGSDVVLTWVEIPVGSDGYPQTITIGSPATEAGRSEDEGPTWTVQVQPFAIMKYEITWDAFNQFRREYGLLQNGRLSPDQFGESQWADAVSIPTPLWEQDSRPILEGLGTDGGYPVADITQFTAMQFSKWLSKKTGQFLRLPTEAEWEYASRCGQQTAFSFGADDSRLGEYAWYFDNSDYDDPDLGYPGLGAGYRKVGTKAANRWGIHDLYGNVAEWTLDAYTADRYASMAGKKHLAEEVVNWPAKIWPAVVRGGSWQDDPERCRSAARTSSTRKWQKRDPQIPKSLWWCTDAFHVGFRLIRPTTPPPEDQRNRWWDPRIESIDRRLKEGFKELRSPILKPQVKEQDG